MIGDSINVKSAVRAVAPWHYRRTEFKNETKAEDNIHYKGWVLVDDRGWRWASKGTKRLRVCRDHGVEHMEAVKEFRRKVDEHEEG